MISLWRSLTKFIFIEALFITVIRTDRNDVMGFMSSKAFGIIKMSWHLGDTTPHSQTKPFLSIYFFCRGFIFIYFQGVSLTHFWQKLGAPSLSPAITLEVCRFYIVCYSFAQWFLSNVDKNVNAGSCKNIVGSDLVFLIKTFFLSQNMWNDDLTVCNDPDLPFGESY